MVKKATREADCFIPADIKVSHLATALTGHGEPGHGRQWVRRSPALDIRRRRSPAKRKRRKKYAHLPVWCCKFPNKLFALAVATGFCKQCWGAVFFAPCAFFPVSIRMRHCGHSLQTKARGRTCKAWRLMDRSSAYAESVRTNFVSVSNAHVEPRIAEQQAQKVS